MCVCVREREGDGGEGSGPPVVSSKLRCEERLASVFTNILTEQNLG